MDFYVCEMLTSPTPAVRLCKHCGAPLLAHGTRVEYCSPSCRNVENVRQSRERMSEKTDHPGLGRSITSSYKI